MCHDEQWPHIRFTVPRQLAHSLRGADVCGHGDERDEEEGQEDDDDVGGEVARAHRVHDPR